MGKAKITCKNSIALKASLELIGTAETKAGGQEKYTLESGLIVNVYDTGSVTFQGKITESKEKILNLIDILNNKED
jgi:predicted nucleotide-binding protein